jgi:hypothetical protein
MASLFVRPALADPAFKKLLPLLIDLPGWQGEKPDGLTMDTGAGEMTMASRRYQKDSAHFEAGLIKGSAAAGAMASINAGLKIETAEMHMLPVEIGGFKGVRSYNSTDKSGAVIMKLADDAVFNVGYRAISEDEALALAGKFDWKAMLAVVSAK